MDEHLRQLQRDALRSPYDYGFKYLRGLSQAGLLPELIAITFTKPSLAHPRNENPEWSLLQPTNYRLGMELDDIMEQLVGYCVDPSKIPAWLKDKLEYTDKHLESFRGVDLSGADEDEDVSGRTAAYYCAYDEPAVSSAMREAIPDYPEGPRKRLDLLQEEIGFPSVIDKEDNLEAVCGKLTKVSTALIVTADVFNFIFPLLRYAWKRVHDVVYDLEDLIEPDQDMLLLEGCWRDIYPHLKEYAIIEINEEGSTFLRGPTLLTKLRKNPDENLLNLEREYFSDPSAESAQHSPLREQINRLRVRSGLIPLPRISSTTNLGFERWFVATTFPNGTKIVSSSFKHEYQTPQLIRRGENLVLVNESWSVSHALFPNRELLDSNTYDFSPTKDSVLAAHSRIIDDLLTHDPNLLPSWNRENY